MAETVLFPSASRLATSSLLLSHGRKTLIPRSLLSPFFSSSLLLPFSLLLHKRLLSFSLSSTRTPAPILHASLRTSRLFSEGRDEDEARLVCPGCGVFMQESDPNLPGYYQKPSSPSPDEDTGYGSEDPLFSDSEEILDELDEGVDGSSSKFDLGEGLVEDLEEEDDWDSDWLDEEDEEERLKRELDGFAPAGVGYGNVTEETLSKMKKEKMSKSEKKRKMREEEAKRMEMENSAVVCARCHSLRNYGQVKNQKAENLIPDFDFDRSISTRLMKPSNSSPVVVLVVDCVDFDGSFPKRAAKSLFKALEGSNKNTKTTKLPKLVLVATKVDLLPSQISPTRLDRWVRNRAKANGAPKLNAVYLVSARKDLGVRNLISYIKELAGPRGNVWVVGAQNAGKSTLINAFAKREGVKITRLTEAAVPGTTLGILRVTGVLPAKAKMYDTPGLLHPYIMTMRLSREEQKMVEIRKELQPRTFRVKAKVVKRDFSANLQLALCLQMHKFQFRTFGGANGPRGWFNEIGPNRGLCGNDLRDGLGVSLCFSSYGEDGECRRLKE
ncbi:GTP-binding protein BRASSINAZOLE INSENSITIVE PALE GREEN 2, chloroplastic isoform X2 [Ananas comosus]|uniref:GTP-binding protein BRASSINAZOLE INSENSITIVE PALE GREEN 2, chloroplastic isoform X2 n=1 Tax=Ananas comosus TaxID=4615 RepID=A0A6P5FQ21_ANACO|nr:GTP-binding protein BRASSINAZOLE INSENSITIVE PALE GREEN 2, chloroplastic isoform X2 [Ananas comosus]